MDGLSRLPVKYCELNC